MSIRTPSFFRSFSLARLTAGAVFFWIVLCASAGSARAAVIPNEPYWSEQWYLRQIHAPEAWAVTTGSRAVIVAMLDGGVDIEHPDLKDNIWTNDHPGSDGHPGDLHGWNFVSNSPDVRPVFQPIQFEDAWSHGTAVASLIGATGGSSGVGMAGVAWNVRIMPLVVLNADGAGQVSDLIQAVRYAVSHGANIINMSLVGYDYDAQLDQTLTDAANAGVVLVAATGNEADIKAGVNIDDTPAYPVCMDGDKNFILGVGGTDTLDQKAPFANYGKKCTDVSAPGQEMFVARPSYPHNPGVATSSVPHYLEKETGTSLAAPLVSGTAALLKSAHPDWSAEQIRARIRATADPIEAGLAPGQVGVLGYGRLNAGRALNDPLPGMAMASVASSSSTTETAKTNPSRQTKVIRRKPIGHKKKAPARRRPRRATLGHL